MSTASTRRSFSPTAPARRRNSSVNRATFSAALKAKGKTAELLVAEGYNHFELFETMANPYGFAGRARLRQMGLA